VARIWPDLGGSAPPQKVPGKCPESAQIWPRGPNLGSAGPPDLGTFPTTIWPENPKKTQKNPVRGVRGGSVRTHPPRAFAPGRFGGKKRNYTEDLTVFLHFLGGAPPPVFCCKVNPSPPHPGFPGSSRHKFRAQRGVAIPQKGANILGDFWLPGHFSPRLTLKQINLASFTLRRSSSYSFFVSGTTRYR